MKRKQIQKQIGFWLAILLLAGCGKKEAAAPVPVESIVESAQDMEADAAEEAEATTSADAALDESAAEAASSATGEAGDEKASAKDSEDPAVRYPEEGRLLHIWCWNEEFRTLMESYVPQYQRVSEEEGRIGGVTVRWTQVESESYIEQLEEALSKNAEAAAEDKIDLFLVGPEEARQIALSGSAMALPALGIAEEELEDQFSYTRSLISDAAGMQRGAAWQICPGALMYRRDLANEILGSDDPEFVQEQVQDWPAFWETAGTMQEAGYQMTATAYDTARAYAGGEGAWVKDGSLQIPAQSAAWVQDTVAALEKEQTGTALMWSDAWNAGLYEDGEVFCYFGPAWLLESSFAKEEEGSVAAAGNWGICPGPQSFYWSGIWLCAAEGCDNPSLSADLIRQITTDAEWMGTYLQETGEAVNARSVLEDAAASRSHKNPLLGGQNPFGIYRQAADACRTEETSVYDARCNDAFESAMSLYFEDLLSYEEAVTSFAEAIKAYDAQIDISDLQFLEEDTEADDISAESGSGPAQ